MKKILLCALILLPTLLSAQGFHYELPASTSVREQPAQAVTMQAQKQKRGFDPSKLEVGGNFGFGFGDDYTSINVSPQVGYALSSYFSAGLGLSYSYNRWSAPYTQTQNYLGGNLYARISPVPFIHIQVQPELYGMWGRAGAYDLPSQMVPVCLVGGGITLPLGGQSGMTAMIFYDVVQDPWSPYGGELVYSIGYTFRF